MKIIIRNENGIKKCFVQVRDINYLAERFNVGRLNRYVLGDRKPEETEFVEIKDMKLAKVIEGCQSIVDFEEMAKLDDFSLGRIILLAHSYLGKESRDEEQRVRDLQDIMSFKQGKLGYQIPVILREVVFENEDMVLGSSTLPGYHILKSINGSLDLDNYLALNLKPLFWMIYPEDEMESYNIIKMNDCLLIHFDVKKKHLSK